MSARFAKKNGVKRHYSFFADSCCFISHFFHPSLLAVLPTN